MKTLRQFSEKEKQYDLYQARVNFLREQQYIQNDLKRAQKKTEKAVEEKQIAVKEKQASLKKEKAAVKENKKLKEALKKAGIDPEQLGS